MIAELKQITLFILAGQMLLHLLPGGGFEKYVRILFRMMIMAQLVLLIFSLGRKNVGELFRTEMNAYAEEMEKIAEQVEQIQLEEGAYEKMALEQALTEKLGETAEALEAEIDEVTVLENDRISIGIRRAEGKIEMVEVKKIRISGTGTKSTVSDKDVQEKAKTEEVLRMRTAELLEISPDQVEVYWNG